MYQQWVYELAGIEMKPSGELEIFGDYELEKGDYLFTMRNLINKPFVLERGGKLNWKGDPYNAQIDLRAKYSTRTTINSMVSSAPENQRVTVDLYLILKGPLMNPTISFEIELPGSSPAWQDELRNKLTNADRLNQQAFSILVLNMFWDEDPAAQTAGSGLAANSVQVLSNQFSNWINSGTKDFIIIRVCAVLILIYSIYLAAFFISTEGINYKVWSSFFQNPINKILTSAFGTTTVPVSRPSKTTPPVAPRARCFASRACPSTLLIL